jgi:hypothetical protein
MNANHTTGADMKTCECCGKKIKVVVVKPSGNTGSRPVICLMTCGCGSWYGSSSVEGDEK